MIGEIVRVTRIANDMTIKDLAKKSKISTSYISEIENNKKSSSISTLIKIAVGFDLELSELLLFDEYHNSLIGKKEKLEIYRSLLLKILETYETNQNNCSKSLNKEYKKIN